MECGNFSKNNFFDCWAASMVVADTFPLIKTWKVRFDISSPFLWNRLLSEREHFFSTIYFFQDISLKKKNRLLMTVEIYFRGVEKMRVDEILRPTWARAQFWAPGSGRTFKAGHVFLFCGLWCTILSMLLLSGSVIKWAQDPYLKSWRFASHF